MSKLDLDELERYSNDGKLSVRAANAIQNLVVEVRRLNEQLANATYDADSSVEALKKWEAENGQLEDRIKILEADADLGRRIRAVGQQGSQADYSYLGKKLLEELGEPGREHPTGACYGTPAFFGEILKKEP